MWQLAEGKIDNGIGGILIVWTEYEQVDEMPMT